MGDGDDHLLALDQILDVVLDLGLLEHGAARGGKPLLHVVELAAHDLQHAVARIQDREILLDLFRQRGELFADLVALEPGQALQPKL